MESTEAIRLAVKDKMSLRAPASLITAVAASVAIAIARKAQDVSWLVI